MDVIRSFAVPIKSLFLYTLCRGDNVRIYSTMSDGIWHLLEVPASTTSLSHQDTRWNGREAPSSAYISGRSWSTQAGYRVKIARSQISSVPSIQHNHGHPLVDAGHDDIGSTQTFRDSHPLSSVPHRKRLTSKKARNCSLMNEEWPLGLGMQPKMQ